MSMATFRKGLSLCENTAEAPSLGGGEPTIHPLFEKMLLEAIGVCDSDQRVFIVTNGKHKRRALVLAKLAKAEVVDARLSQDEWHEDIDPFVVQAFHGRYNDVSDNGRKYALAYGRGAELYGLDPDGSDEEECACPEWVIQPNGRIFQCGCPDSPQIGHVDTGFMGLVTIALCVCHKSDEYKEAVEESREAA
jgi:hypothetical protein